MKIPQEQDFTQAVALWREWNGKINVVSRKDEDNIFAHHILHSLAIAEYLDIYYPSARSRWAGRSTPKIGRFSGTPESDPQGADHPGIARPTGRRKPNPRISIIDDGTSTNETRLGAVRDIQLGIEAAGSDDDLFVMAGDNLLSFSLCDFLSYAREKGTTCIMRYYEADPARLRKSGVAEVDASGRVLSMEEKPAQPKDHWCCPPFYYIARADVPKVAEAISSGCGVDAPGSFIAWLSARTTVHAWEMPGPRYDIGSLESYEAAKRLFDR